MHPAHAVVERVESCWSDSPEQAANRSALVLRALTDAGHVIGGEWRDTRYVLVEPPEKAVP